MLSYQHAYHAGGPADLHKHIALAELLALLTRKPRPLTYMETHAGRGMYDLASVEAAKTGEAAEGIAKVDLRESPFTRVLRDIRAREGATAYPGSPAIAREMLRDTDRMYLMELHPAEHKALQRQMQGARVSVQFRDGFEGVMETAPPRPRTGLVLIDPSYEVKAEYQQVANFTNALVKKWPEAIVMIWYPLLKAERHSAMLEALKPPHLIDEVAFGLKENKGMTGSGIALVNAPYGAENVFAKTREIASQILR